MQEYLRAFVIGSSWPIFILYFLAVASYGSQINVDYQHYTWIAPLFLGALNMVGLYLSKKSDLWQDHRFILTGVLGATIVATFISLFDVYRCTSTEWWIQHYVLLFVVYIVVYGVVVRTLDGTI